MRNAALAVVTGAIVVCGSLVAARSKEPPNPSKPTDHAVPQVSPAVSIQKPDLIIEKIVWTTAPNPGGGTVVSYTYTVYNKGPVATRSRPTAAGAKIWHDNPVTNWTFTVWTDMRDYPNGKFPPLGMGTGIELGAFQKMDLPGGGVVPPGKRVQFRATADSLNWIDESDETNNSKTFVWPPFVPAKTAVPK